MAEADAILFRPIAWRLPALAPLLTDLPANILKGHGRRHTRNLFLRIPANARDAVRTVLAALPLTSALDQLEAAEERRLTGADGGPVLLCFLSASGYRALGVPDRQTPADPAFREGMVARRLQDRLEQWEDCYQKPVDALVLVGANSEAAADALAKRHKTRLLAAGAELAVEEAGTALLRENIGIEHFGFVDGRSQPLMLEDEVMRELNGQGESFIWDPGFGPLEIALASDPGGSHAHSYGSYLVYRKLEQDVAGFADAIETLTDALELMGDDARQLGGALVIGRFPDGTPVSTSKRPLGAAHVANNFVYSGDPEGTRCPFQAHIRKSNPRGETVTVLGATLEEERSHLMVRRGIPYGARAADLSDRPSNGVGLLFMAYNQNIARQFEFVQRKWLDDANFMRRRMGTDPLVGRGMARHDWPKSWDHSEAGTTRVDLQSFVTMKGGEYFFAPSISFLRGLRN